MFIVLLLNFVEILYRSLYICISLYLFIYIIFFFWFNSYEVFIKFVLFIMSWFFILILLVSENWYLYNLVII